MGFLDRAAKAAANARSQIDDVRELRAQASVKPVAPAGLGEHEQQVIARARALGAPDPSVLLTAPEAADVAGVEVGGPHLVYGDDFLGARYEAAGSGGRLWRVSVSAFHAVDEAGFDAASYWFGFLADTVADDGVTVADLGDVAVVRDADLFVLADPLLLMVEVSTPFDDDRERMVRLARQVVGRLLA